MPKRQSNNPKRRIIAETQSNQAEKVQLQRKVRYVGSGHHKHHPADYGFMRLNPRPTKSLCDLVRTIQKSEAEELVIKGIQQGMYSALDENGIPKFIWSVSELGEVFEAKTDTHGSGHYHGYPLEDEDTMKLHVISVWKQRCHLAGQ